MHIQNRCSSDESHGLISNRTTKTGDRRAPENLGASAPGLGSCSGRFPHPQPGLSSLAEPRLSCPADGNGSLGFLQLMWISQRAEGVRGCRQLRPFPRPLGRPHWGFSCPPSFQGGRYSGFERGEETLPWEGKLEVGNTKHPSSLGSTEKRPLDLLPSRAECLAGFRVPPAPLHAA